MDTLLDTYLQPHVPMFMLSVNHSTEHALLDIVSKIQKYMDTNFFARGIFIDLQKAFDYVDHELLLLELNHYGIRGIANNWFCSYLTGRYQTTQISTKF